MKDRIAQYPGRRKMTDVLTGDEFIFDVELAEGNVSEAGTPFNKANILSDETAAALGLTSAATPNDAFAKIAADIPDIVELQVSENGVYSAPAGSAYSPVIVSVAGGGGNPRYKQLTPLHFDVDTGYIGGSSGDWIYDTNQTGLYLSDIYKIQKNKRYLIHFGATVDNRFRIASYLTDVATATVDVTRYQFIQGSELDGTIQPYAIKVNVINTSTKNCVIWENTGQADEVYLAIQKTSQGVSGIKIYVTEFDESGFDYYSDYVKIIEGTVEEITLPEGITKIGQGCMRNRRQLLRCTIPEGVVQIYSNAFEYDDAMTYVKFPASLQYISSKAFNNCTAVLEYDFTDATAVPSLLASDVFGTLNANCKIVVPDSLYSTWIATTRWVDIASYIIKESDYVTP